MFRKTLITAVATVVATAGLLASAGTARAQQQGWPYTGGNEGYGGGDAYDYGNRGNPSDSAPLASVPTYSYYAAPANGDVANPVQIVMNVPANASVWFDEKSTTQSGVNRSFVSPSLDPNANYHYHIKVSWKEDGHDVTQVRDIAVHAGDVLNLSFGPSTVAAAGR